MREAYAEFRARPLIKRGCHTFSLGRTLSASYRAEGSNAGHSGRGGSRSIASPSWTSRQLVGPSLSE